MSVDRMRRHASMSARLFAALAALSCLATSDVLADAPAAPRDFDEAAALQEGVGASADDRVIGRVTGVHGRVYAEAPDGTRRVLVENAPVYPGDRLVTRRGAQLGVLSGDHYTGLNEETELSFALTPGGAPKVDLVRGHVRVIEAGDEGAPAELKTPALRVAATGGDVEVYAFPEKAYLVSMVCALEGQVQAAAIAGGSATVDEGGCAIVKPAEGLYAAGAAGSALAPVGAAGAAGNALAPVGAAGAAGAAGSALAPVGAAGAAGTPTPFAGTAADHFASPDSVGSDAFFAFSAPPMFANEGPPVAPCSTGATGACGAGFAPPNPPTNPPVPGLPPVPPPNPPTNPPVPGLPPVP